VAPSANKHPRQNCIDASGIRTLDGLPHTSNSLALVDLDDLVEHLEGFGVCARALEGVAADDRAVAAAGADARTSSKTASSPLASPPENTTMRLPLKQPAPRARRAAWVEMSILPSS
jgi:hypothetical protein